MSIERENIRNLLNSGAFASQSSDSKAAADMSIQTDSDEKIKIDCLFSAVKILDCDQVEAVLTKNPEYIFKKSSIMISDNVLDFILDSDLNWKTTADWEKVEKIVKLISNAYAHMLVESSLTEAQLNAFHRFNQTMAERISNFKIQMLKLVAEHDATLTKIAKSTFFEPFCYDNPINRTLFVLALQKNCNMFSLSVNYSDAFEDLAKILMVNRMLVRIVIGERCVWTGKSFQEFISALNHSNVKELCFIGSMQEECLKMFLQCKNLQKLEFIDLSSQIQGEGHSWNSELSEALLANRTLKVLDISLSSGLPEFLNCITNQKSLISLTCRKRGYNKQNEACELAAIKNLIIHNRNLTILKLDFAIDYSDKTKAIETICSSLTKNESLTYFGFDPFFNSNPNNKAWSEYLVEAIKNIFNDNYTLTDVYIRTLSGFEKLSYYVNSHVGFIIAARLGLDKNHVHLHEIYRQSARNDKISKILKHVNEASESYNKRQFSEAHRKILQAFDEVKPFLGTVVLNINDPLYVHTLDAPYILGKMLARKFPNFLFYACHAFSAIKPSNPYYAQAKFELSIIIRNGVDLKATLENPSEVLLEEDCLDPESLVNGGAAEKLKERLYRSEKNSLLELQQEYENSSEAHLEQAITALPHLLEIQKADQRLPEKLEVGQEIKSLAEFYVNNGWANAESEPKIELGEIGENPATIINLLNLLKKQKDQYETLSKLLEQIHGESSGQGERTGMELQSPKKSSGSKVAVSPKTERTTSESGSEKGERGKKRVSNSASQNSDSDSNSGDAQEPAFKKRKLG